MVYVDLCSKCQNQFLGDGNDCGDTFWRKDVKHRKKSKKSKKKKHKARTSTPVPEVDTINRSTFSDSVTEFFYQSWKNGLHSDNTTESQPQTESCFCSLYGTPLSVYNTQFVYVNAYVYQPYVPTAGFSYAQPVGYRPDGTFGVIPIPTYWCYAPQ